MACPRGSVDLSSRPSFPDGLRVLLVEQRQQHQQQQEGGAAGSTAAAASGSGSATRQQLEQLKYAVTEAADVPAALVALRSSSEAHDVVLADAAVVGDLGGAAAVSLFAAAGRVPLVLMGDEASTAPAQVLAAVRHGAADFLHKPLSQPKLRNLWQHTVRSMMARPEGAARSGRPSPTAAEAEAAAATAPGAAEAGAAAPAAAGDCPAGLGLPLPPLTFDPDSILLDLDCPVLPDEPTLDDILVAPRSPPGGSLAASDAAADQLLAACSSDPWSGQASGATVFASDLDVGADGASSRPNGSRRLGSPAAASVGLRCHGPIRRGDAPGRSAQRLPAAEQAALGSPAAAPAAAGSPAPAAPGACWGGPAPLPHGMVWGMPMPAVTAPGLLPAKPGAAASSAPGQAPSGGGAAAGTLPCWPGMPLLPAVPAGAAAGAAQPLPMAMPWAPAFPGAMLFPPWGAGGAAFAAAAAAPLPRMMLGPMAPLATPMPVPCAWPARGVPTASAPSAAAPAAPPASAKLGGFSPSDSCTSSQDAAGTRAGVAHMCRSGSVVSSGLVAGQAIGKPTAACSGPWPNNLLPAGGSSSAHERLVC